MISVSTKQTIVYEPLQGLQMDDPPKFVLRSGEVIERGMMEGELAGPPYRAGDVYPWEKTAALRSGVETLLSGDDGASELIDLIAAAAQGGEGELSAADAQKLANMRSIMAEHWPPYAELIAREERRRKVAPIVAFRRYCVGIEGNASKAGKPIEIKLGRDGLVSDETLQELDPTLLTMAGNEAFALQYGGGHVKNSERLSQSEESQTATEQDEQSPTDGSSERTNGKKTPGSRSRHGRSK